MCALHTTRSYTRLLGELTTNSTDDKRSKRRTCSKKVTTQIQKLG